ncbi:MAG: hypothetical protein LBU87_07085 [Lactobacillales bacterium]|jgi:hypothetical protein|nr:hypothetical protein [Lactobacillales bacterium]
MLKQKLKKAELLTYATQIKLVMRFDQLKAVFAFNPENHGELCYILEKDIKESFTSDPKRMMLATDLTSVLEIVTRHTCGYPPMFFVPSIEEVLLQIPSDALKSGNIVAFETRLKTVDINDPSLYDRENGEHIAATTLYSGKLPPEIQRQPVIVGGQKLTPLQIQNMRAKMRG